jgi:3,4-dihydroxyphenylacetate 2,3-dioxygenase
MNDLEECFRWGRYVVQSLRESSRRGVFVASGALSHRLVRGPEKWPLPEHMELDRRFAACSRTATTTGCGVSGVREIVDEMGGRHLAMTLGTRRSRHLFTPQSTPIRLEAELRDFTAR